MQKSKPDDEFFDIVDDNDNPIGRAPRAEVHAKKLKHRAVHIWIFNSKNELLLQRRSAAKDTCPNQLTSSVCGHVDAGEDYLTAAHRELKEEAGLENITDLTEIAYEPASPNTFNEFTRIYKITHNGPFQFPETEISELFWLPLNELSQRIRTNPQEFAPLFPHLWLRYSPLITDAASSA
jgi:16S rRNA (adenine1518-N6/adenine1519-N6)-dimethyltransferase